MRKNIDLNDYNLIIINSSAGKDSLCSLFEISELARIQNYPLAQIWVSHQDLGEAEWAGTDQLAEKQAALFNFNFIKTKRKNKDGYEETMLEAVERRGKWPSSTVRYCTSDFKRDPGSRIVTQLTRDLGNCSVLHIFGFRAEESPARSKKEVYSLNKRLTTKKREVYDYLPIHSWKLDQVWETIRSNDLPYHPAYDLGMPRLSCTFCIFSPFDALVVAGKHNPELLEKYVEVEERIGHSFKMNETIKKVKEAIQNGYEPKNLNDWRM